MTGPKITKVCPNCDSTEVSRDADARWNNETQSWEVSALYDSFHCDACSESIRDVEDQDLED